MGRVLDVARGSNAGGWLLRAAVLVGTISCPLLAVANAKAATVTIGSPLTATSSTISAFANLTLIDNALGEPGATLASPVTGTIVRWRITGASGAGGPFELRVLTPVGGTTYTGAGTSSPETPSSMATQTYSTNMPIAAGQMIGLDMSGADAIGAGLPAGASFGYIAPPLMDGATAAENLTQSGEADFNADVQPLPTVTGMSPSSGPTGTTVTITGTNFQGTTAVSFGSTPAASFTVVSDTELTAVAPAGAGTVDVTVRNPGQSAVTAADRFTYTKSLHCVVPKLKGKTLKVAHKALKTAHCMLGKVNGPTAKSATVTKQKPKSGKVLPVGSKVNLTTKK
jgi:hypothetical protein